MPLPPGLESVGLAWGKPADMPGSTGVPYYSYLVNKFNVYKIPDYDNMTEPFIGHIFMSRPSLEINANDTTMTKIAQLHNVMTDKLGRELALSLDRTYWQKWIPLVSLRAKNYTVNDIELKSVEKSSTFYGHTVTYSKHSEEHKMGGTFSIDFRNDRFFSIFKLMYVWLFYIYNVSKNDAIKVNPEYEEKGILDYCGSLYYVVTRTDNCRIIYWDKLVGVRPKKIPLSIFSWDDATKIEDTISIDFEYGIRSDPMDPAILLDINTLAGNSPDGAFDAMMNLNQPFTRPTYNMNYRGAPYVSYPVISAVRNNDNKYSEIEYYLEYL